MENLVLEDLRECVLTLQHQNLITEAEKNAIINTDGGKEKIQSDMFTLLMGKNIDCSLKILKVLQNEAANKSSLVDFENVSDKHSQLLHSAKNPLKIAGVIQCVYSFLPLDDIKNCRLVSKEWNYVAEPVLRKRSQISIGYPANPKCFSKSMKEFKDAFEFCQTAIPFTALRLTKFKGNSAPWPKCALEKVLNEWGSNLKELTLDHFVVQGYQNPFIVLRMGGDILITRLNICQPRVSIGNYNSKLKLSLENLLKIKYLRIDGCDLSIPDGYKISPIEVDLKNCSILYHEERDGSEFTNFIDFKEVKMFTYHYHGFSNNGMTLDLKGNFKLELLDLSEIRILNETSSNWTVDKMILCKTTFTGLAGLKVRELVVDSYFDSISYIPPTVEKLTFTCTNDNFSGRFCFPILQHLILTLTPCIYLRYVENCRSLVKLEFRQGSRYKINWLPPTLTKLRLQGATTTTRLEKYHTSFDTLVLESFSVLYATKIFHKYHAMQYVWSFSKSEEGLLDMKKLNIIVQLLKENNIKVAVGKFRWKKINFASSPLFHLVDKQAEYYSFENKMGLAITKYQFEKMMKL